MSLLVAEDLFTTGLGCDVAGAYLVIRGLFASPSAIVGRATPRYDVRGVDIKDGAEGRADATLGFVALASGFSLQALGYAAALAGDSDGVRDGDLGRAATALALAVLASAFALGVSHLVRRRLARRFVVLVARAYAREHYNEAEPALAALLAAGQEMGYTRSAGEEGVEGGVRYAARVFGVQRVSQRAGDVLVVGPATSEPV